MRMSVDDDIKIAALRQRVDQRLLVRQEQPPPAELKQMRVLMDAPDRFIHRPQAEPLPVVVSEDAEKRYAPLFQRLETARGERRDVIPPREVSSSALRRTAAVRLRLAFQCCRANRIGRRSSCLPPFSAARLPHDTRFNGAAHDGKKQGCLYRR